MKLLQLFYRSASNREMPPSLQHTHSMKVSTNEIVIVGFMSGYEIFDSMNGFMIDVRLE